MLTNIGQGDLRGRNMVNIHIPLAALLCWDNDWFYRPRGPTWTQQIWPRGPTWTQHG